VDVADDRADHRRRERAVALLDQRVEVVLRAERGGHRRVVLEQAQAGDSPVAAVARQLVHVQREMCAVKAAHAHMDDPRDELRAVVRGDGDPAPGDLRELCLAEYDGRRPNHGGHINTRTSNEQAFE
jgi:hypothetical protein